MTRARDTAGIVHAVPGQNLLINGDFRIWQRGTSLASGSGTRYCADRWAVASSSTDAAVSREAFALGQTAVPGEPEFFHRVVVVSEAGAANYARLRQHIEDVRTLAGQDGKLHLAMKADAAKPVTIELSQYFGTGGAPSAVVHTTIEKVNLTDQWDLYEIDIPVPSIAGKTIGSDGTHTSYLALNIWLEAGSNYDSRTDTLGQQSGTFDFAVVKLEKGSVATPFVPRPLAEELALCQRYYEKSEGAEGSMVLFSGYAVSGGDFFKAVHFKTTKRVAPTVTAPGYAATLFGTRSIAQIDVGGFRAYAVASGTGVGYFENTWTADAEL